MFWVNDDRLVDCENRQIYKYKFKMAAVAMATMTVLMITSS